MLSIYPRRDVSVLLLWCSAHSLAQSQQYDEDGIVDIFRQYGDHLYRYLLQYLACLH